MISRTNFWTAKDGTRLYIRYWEPENMAPKAVINLVHGMGEHVDRYEHVANFFTSNGFALVGFDHRGHGKSDGNRGHIPSYDVLLDDVELFLEKNAETYPGIPAFLYGHSMGSGVSANFLIRRKPQGLKAALLSAPYFRLAFPQPTPKLWLGRMMQNVLPKLSLPTGLNADHVSRDKTVVTRYKNDPLVHDKISAMMGISLVDSGEYALAHAKEVEVPTLVLHGTGDLLTSHEASKEFAEKAGKNVEIILYEGLYHEIHNEPEQEKVLNDALTWFNKFI